MFLDALLAMRCIGAVVTIWPDSAPVTVMQLDQPSREHVGGWIRSVPGIPPDISVLFADDTLFLDLVHELARLSRSNSTTQVTP